MADHAGDLRPRTANVPSGDSEPLTDGVRGAENLPRQLFIDQALQRGVLTVVSGEQPSSLQRYADGLKVPWCRRPPIRIDIPDFRLVLKLHEPGLRDPAQREAIHEARRAVTLGVISGVSPQLPLPLSSQGSSRRAKVNSEWPQATEMNCRPSTI